MNKFLKKYNHKNIQSTKKNTKKWLEMYSNIFSLDQKMHPWCVFSLFLQDTFSNINETKNNPININTWFGLSSKFYSKLNDDFLSSNQLKVEVLKQKKQNIKFFNKIGFSDFISEKSYLFSEDFNLYIRKVFIDLHSNSKIFSQKETIYRNKELQTNLFSDNIKCEKKSIIQYCIKYFIESKWIALSTYTTEIEKIFADVAVAVNPNDKRYKKFIWQNLIIPIVNKNIPIIWDESVDPFIGSGVVRITPWHDEYGLQIAKKHNLPIDVFAVDTKWYFTSNAWEFANKPVWEFLENIIKYIDDIWNLESTKTIQEDVFYDLKSWEKLEKVSLDQRNIKYMYALDYLSEKLRWSDLEIYPLEKKEKILQLLENKKNINISNKSKKWILIPVLKTQNWDHLTINDEIFSQQYESIKSKKQIILSLIILNLILDNQINSSFSVEELIDVLFDLDFLWEKTKINRYIDIYSQQNKFKYKNWLKQLNKIFLKLEKDHEKIKILEELLEDSFAIKKTWDVFMLDFTEIFPWQESLLLQTEDSFSKSFMDSVRFMYYNNFEKKDIPYQKVEIDDWFFLASKDDGDFVINTILLMLEYSKKIIFSKILFHEDLVDQKNNKISASNSKFLTKDLIDNCELYWYDVMRLLLLFWEKKDKQIIFDTYQSQNRNMILNKIWNAYRYVYQKYLEWKNKNTKIKNIVQTIEEDITDYDLWILHSIKYILDEFAYQSDEYKIIDLWKKIFNFVTNDLCYKYLEATKIHSSQNTESIVVFAFSVLLKLIKIYIPSFWSYIESILKIDRSDYNVLDFKNFQLKEKNYKINILMDIVDKINWLKQKIWAKKHEGISVFIQANPDLIEFLSQSEEFLKSILNISDLNYIRIHESIPNWYQLDNVININIGVKSIAQQKEIKKDVLLEMQEELDSKKEYLQHLKSLVASIIQSASPEIIQQKKKDIQKLQKEIDDLDFNINKIKSNR